MFGFHILDLTVIFGYFCVMVFIGVWVARRIKNEDDFFMGGRKLGTILQMFMNFGMATSTETAVGAARETFRQGLAGIWLKLFLLFITPFYWISTVWLRRLRMNSMAELFKIRYESIFMERSYAIYGLISFMAMISVNLVALQKTVEVISPKAAEHLSVKEQRYVDNFNKMNVLKEKMEHSALTSDELDEFERLKSLKAQGQVRSSVSYLNPYVFMPIIALIVIVYAVAGGLLAAAITDFIQGALLVVLSLLLLPIGLVKIGGFAGLHERVPESFFNLFGSATMSEYPWYYVVAMAAMGLCMVEASPHNCQVMGSAKDEEASRVGRVFGNFLKRFTIVAWGFTGVIGYGLYKNAVGDPDMLWGHMTRNLLTPGLIGLMIVCLLAALMSTADTFVIASGILFTQNFYRPLVPGKSDAHYLFVGRVAGASILLGATIIALFFQDILRIIRFIWSLGLVFGPVYWMGMVWRRSNTRGAISALAYTALFTVLVSYFIQYVGPVSRVQGLVKQTSPKVIMAMAEATQEDVDQGKAGYEGQSIKKEIQIPARGIFFEDVVRENPNDPNSPLMGKNRFRTSLLIPAALGVDFSNWSKGQLISFGYYLDLIIPFLIIFLVSRFTAMNSRKTLDSFYGRLHTPCVGGPYQDKVEMELTEKDPNRFQLRNLFPKTNIELQKPSARDVGGFLLAWLMVGGIVLLVILLSQIGS
jgi:SSS family solute:Na+ symporter